MTDRQHIAQAALARIRSAYARGTGTRLTADEVDALTTQTILGELCSQASSEREAEQNLFVLGEHG